MKKTLLLSAALIAGIGVSAQTAKLTDVTPPGYDFSKYENGAILKAHTVPVGEASGWGAPKASYNASDMTANGHFITLDRYGGPIVAGDEDALRIYDFGGHLGKCLVFSTMYGPMQVQTKSGFGPSKSVTAIGGHSSYTLGFYSDGSTIQHGWSSGAIRVRIVYTVLQRARHAAEYGFPATPKTMIEGFFAFSNGNYVPSAVNGDNPLTSKGFDMSEYVKWQNESDCVAEMPANHVVLTGEEDLFDTAGNMNTEFANQLNRFQVMEFDVYSPTQGIPVVAVMKIKNHHATVVIKEIKFFNIDNAEELLDASNDYEPIPGASYLYDRHVSYRYYTEKGLTEFETTKPIDPTPEVKGSGTEADPYQITTPYHLATMWNKFKELDMEEVYFTLENDIDMSEYTQPYAPAVGWNGGGAPDYYGFIIHFDGKNHVIKNFKAQKATDEDVYAYPSIFGVANGEIRNLGIEDFEITSTDGAGILGGYAAHGLSATTLTVENVWATGTINAKGGYTGGLIGTNVNDVTFKNCYTNIIINNDNNAAFVGGLIGRAAANVKIENCYAAGEINGNAAHAGGLASTKAGATLTTNGAAVMLSKIEGANADIIAANFASVPAATTWAETKVNGTANAAGLTTAQMQATIKGWDAFNEGKLNGIYPIFNWLEGQSGIGEIIVDEAGDAAPVYFNLQGVQVENPTNGLYIVKRGNKVTKEIIR